MKEINDTISDLKKTGHKVCKTTIDGKAYTYTNFLRSEWKNLQKELAEIQGKVIASDPAAIGVKEAGEELIVVRALLSPEPTPTTISSLPAGLISTLADLILQASGFGLKEPVVEEL